VSRLTPDQINLIVDDVVGKAWAKEELDSLLQRLNDIHERVEKRAQAELFDGPKLVTLGPQESHFAKVQKMVLDDLVNHRLSYDELMFAFSYDVARKITERIL